MTYHQYDKPQTYTYPNDAVKRGLDMHELYADMVEGNKQKYMDLHFGGVSFDGVLELVKQHYPEKFI